MHKDTLQIKTTDHDICEIFERHELAMIEYNPMQSQSMNPSFANSKQLRSQQKATP